jgi:lipopolysaccharide biosynthesis glycosyltransferase
VRSPGDDALVELVFVTDDGYARQTVTALYSIARSTRSDVMTHIVFTELSYESRSKLQKTVETLGWHLLFHAVDKDWLRNFPEPMHQCYTKDVFLRLGLPNILTASRRCIYLDPDILVRHDITELWNWPMENRPIAAVKDIELAKEHGKRIRLPEGHTYFNAGVLLLDLEMLRQSAFEEAAITFAATEPERVQLNDQDILNILLAKNVSYLPLKWNYCPLWTDHGSSGNFRWRNIQTYYDEAERLAADLDPALVHFANIHKPWHSSVESIEHPFQEEYRRCDERANPDCFPRLPAAKPTLSCVLPVCDADDSVFQTITSLLSQTSDDIEIVAFSLVQDGRVTALLETTARWNRSFKLVQVGNSSPAKGLLDTLQLVGADRMIFIPPGTFLDRDFLSLVTKQLVQAEVGPAGCTPAPIWTKEGWWRIVIESEAARRAAALVCQSVDGYMVFYCTVLQAWMGDPEKVKSVPTEADAWDARRTPHVHAKDVLELREFLGYATRRDRREAVAKTRSLLNCFRYLEPGEKWRFLAGLGRCESAKSTAGQAR